MTRLQWLRGTIAIVLLFVILGNVAFPAASAAKLADPDPASASVSESAAKKIVKDALSLPQDFNFWDSELINRRGNSSLLPVWHLSGNSEHELAELIVDAVNGDILALEALYDPPGELSFSPKYTRDQAMAAAKAFIQKAIPSIKGLSLIERPRYGSDSRFQTPLFGPATYSFTFELAYQGIPLAGHGLSIQLNAAGKVTKLDYSGTKFKIVARTPVLSVGEADKIWADSIRMGLVYERKWFVDEQEFDLGVWQLLYRPYNAADFIDAANGTPDTSGIGAVFDPASYEAIVAAGHRFVPRAIGSEEEAIRVVSGDFFLQGIDWKARKPEDADQWSLEFNNEEWSGDALVDGSTGRLIRYRMYAKSNERTTERVASEDTKGKVRAIADRFMNEYVPDFTEDYKRKIGTTPYEEPMKDDEQVYQRVHRGIVVWDAEARVTVDDSGKVIAFDEERVDEKELDALKSTISADEAKNKMLEAYRMKLVYGRNIYVTDQGADDHLYPMELAYIPEDQQPYSELSGVVDAVTGTRVPADPDYSRARGGPLPSTYKKHPSAKALQLMLDHGVIRLDKDGQMYPDTTVSRIGFWEMLVYGILLGRTMYLEDEENFADTAGLDANYRGYLQFAIERHWLKANPSGKFNPNGALTREQLAVWLTAVIGYDKAAMQLAKDPIVTKLKDAGKIGNLGAVALMLKLGLMQPTGGQFKPKDAVTLAEAAETFKRLAEKQNELDSPFYTTEDSMVTKYWASDF